jgi:hypothetical protein
MWITAQKGVIAQSTSESLDTKAQLSITPKSRVHCSHICDMSGTVNTESLQRFHIPISTTCIEMVQYI